MKIGGVLLGVLHGISLLVMVFFQHYFLRLRSEFMNFSQSYHEYCVDGIEYVDNSLHENK